MVAGGREAEGAGEPGEGRGGGRGEPGEAAVADLGFEGGDGGAGGGVSVAALAAWPGEEPPRLDGAGSGEDAGLGLPSDGFPGRRPGPGAAGPW